MGIQLKSRNENLSLAQKALKGDPGGYYIPEIEENGDLNWKPSEEGMPEVPGSNIIGPEGPIGKSGIWTGDAEPTEEYDVWISPAGEASETLVTVDEMAKYVDNAIENIEIPTPEDVDLSNYYTKEEVDKKIPDTSQFITEEGLTAKGYQTKTEVEAMIPDTSSFATKEEIPDVSNFATKDEIPTIPDTSNFATKDEIPDVSNFATKDEIPTVPDVSNFATKDEIPDVSNFITAEAIPDTSNFITMQDVEGKGYQTAEQVNQLISAALPASVEGVKF